MTQVGKINQAIQNTYEALEKMPEPKPVNTGLLSRTEKKQPEEKINDIRFQLLKAGILEVEIRTKDVDGKTLYTIIYDNYGRLNKINW